MDSHDFSQQQHKEPTFDFWTSLILVIAGVWIIYIWYTIGTQNLLKQAYDFLQFASAITFIPFGWWFIRLIDRHKSKIIEHAELLEEHSRYDERIDDQSEAAGDLAKNLKDTRASLNRLELTLNGIKKDLDQVRGIPEIDIAIKAQIAALAAKRATYAALQEELKRE